MPVPLPVSVGGSNGLYPNGDLDGAAGPSSGVGPPVVIASNSACLVSLVNRFFLVSPVLRLVLPSRSVLCAETVCAGEAIVVPVVVGLLL